MLVCWLLLFLRAEQSKWEFLIAHYTEHSVSHHYYKVNINFERVSPASLFSDVVEATDMKSTTQEQCAKQNKEFLVVCLA